LTEKEKPLIEGFKKEGMNDATKKYILTKQIRYVYRKYNYLNHENELTSINQIDV